MMTDAQHAAVQRSSRWRIGGVLVCATLLAPPVAYVIGAADQWRAVDLVAAWCYAAVLVAVIAVLAGVVVPTPALPSRFRWLARVSYGQTRAGWLLAGSVALAVGYALVRLGVGAPLPHAVWVKVALDAPTSAPPAVAVRYNAATDTMPMQWQPYGTTLIALHRAANASAPLQVLALTTDRGPVDLAQITVDTQPGTGKITITNPVGALLSWPGPTRAFTLTLAGQGATDVLWNDQRTQVTLGAQPVQAALKLDGWQGWALLPPQQIAQLALTLPAGSALRHIDVFSDPPQTWDAAALTPDQSHHVQLVNFRPLNSPNYGRQLGATLAIAALLLGALVALAFGARRLERVAERYEFIETPLGAWMRRSDAWGRRRVMLGVWLVALTWHLTYTFAVPWDATNDSPGYYSFGQQMLHTQQFARILSERTPGYPIFLALIMLVAGNSAMAIIVLQHVALTLLAPLVVWVLAERLSLLGAALAGFALAILPCVSMIANMIHTEAVYTALTTAALLVYLRWNVHPRGLLFIGVLLGAATMFRPTALLALGAIIGWLLLQGWCAVAGGRVQRFALLGSAALVVSYAAIAAPWHLHLALVRHTLDLSDGRAALTRWDSAVQQRRFDSTLAVLRPDQAVWDVWNDRRYQDYTDPFTFFAVYPELISGMGQIALTQIDSVLGNQRVFNETVRQSDAANPQRLHANQLVALRGNLLFRWDNDQDFIAWTDLSDWFIRNWQITPQPVSTTPFTQMLYRPLPEHSWVRALCLRLSLFGFQRWYGAAFAAMLSLAVLVLYRPVRALIPCWLYWFGLVLSTSALGMPVQRYLVVAEPVLYVLAIVYTITLLAVRPRRVVPAPGAVSG